MDGTVKTGGALLLLLLAGPARAQSVTAPQPDSEVAPEVRERATLLAAHLPDEIYRESVAPVLGWTIATLGAAGVVLAVLVKYPDPAQKALWIAGPATYTVGGVTTAIVPGEYRQDVLYPTWTLGFGSFWLAIGLGGEHDLRLVTPVAVASGYYTAGALGLLSLALSRPTPLAKLRADYGAVYSPRGRAGLSAQRVDAIEADIRGSKRVLPPWVLAAPLVLGGLVGTVPAFDKRLPGDVRAFSAAIGVTTAALGLSLAFVPVPHNDYETSLHRAGLGVSAAPTSGGAELAVSGQF